MATDLLKCEAGFLLKISCIVFFLLFAGLVLLFRYSCVSALSWMTGPVILFWRRLWYNWEVIPPGFSSALKRGLFTSCVAWPIKELGVTVHIRDYSTADGLFGLVCMQHWPLLTHLGSAYFFFFIFLFFFSMSIIYIFPSAHCCGSAQVSAWLQLQPLEENTQVI